MNTWQRCGRSCGSSASASWRACGPRRQTNKSWPTLPEVSLPSPSSRSSPGWGWGRVRISFEFAVIKDPSTNSKFSLQSLLTYFALARYRQGVNEFEQEYRDPANDHNAPYQSSPYSSTSGPSGYQQSPFSNTQETPGAYQPPSYWKTKIQRQESNEEVFLFKYVCQLFLLQSRTVLCTPPSVPAERVWFSGCTDIFLVSCNGGSFAAWPRLSCLCTKTAADFSVPPLVTIASAVCCCSYQSTNYQKG